ncbi:beta-1,3-galactosyltransferase 5-like isoform X2 [Antennarius striatus]|uniref:beta-1,3-galactosyltransferase 5-like isoform X2 n=1 Tax=Antennarius striatus TaxID=241820 RepID=UPI0035B27865
MDWKESRKPGRNSHLMGDPETGSGGLKRHADPPSHQKKPWGHSLFQFLLLVCLLFGILCYALFNSALWERFPIRHHRHRVFNLTTGFWGSPEHRLAPSEPPETPTTTTTMTTTTTTPPVGFQYHHAYPRNYLFILDNKDVCKTKNPFLVLMVPVRPSNVEARNAIRQTWGKEMLVQDKVVVTMFMLGDSGGNEEDQKKLQQENLQHRDLIQSNFIDSYANLTIKTMVIMNWLATRCPEAAYGMKIDADMFLNIDNLVEMLKQPDIPKTEYLTGYLMWNRPVVRSRNSKWYVSEELYPEPTYPTYTLGMGYVFSNDLPFKFVEISKSVKFFNIEDAYIGMCMKMLGLAPRSPPVPSRFKAYNSQYNRCDFSKVITYILGSSKELLDYWTDLKKPGPPC